MGVTTSQRTDPFAKPTAKDAAAEVRERLDEPAKFVFLQGAVCPRCGSFGPKAHRHLRTSRSQDGSLARATLCQKCNWRFTIVIEFLPFGG